MTDYRLVRNQPMEKLLTGAPQPFAPYYDVEEVDVWRMPVRVIAYGIGAEAAREAIGKAGGVEARN